MEKVNISTAERFRQIRERLGFTQQQLAERLLLSRNYIAQIEMGTRDPSVRVLNTIETLAADVDRDAQSTIPTLKKDVNYRNSGSRRDSKVGESPMSSPPLVASRLPPEARSPSTRADVEQYMQLLIEAAEQSGNPNAWPVIHDRLRKRFPLSEWEPET